MPLSHNRLFSEGALFVPALQFEEDRAPSVSVSLMHGTVQNEGLTWPCRRNMGPWCSAVKQGLGRPNQRAEGWTDQLFLSWRNSTTTTNGTFSFREPWHSSDPLVTKPEEKLLQGEKKWPCYGLVKELDWLTRWSAQWKGEFRTLEGKNRKAAREEGPGQPPSAQQILAMAQLPWKEVTGWVASPDWI